MERAKTHMERAKTHSESAPRVEDLVVAVRGRSLAGTKVRPRPSLACLGGLTCLCTWAIQEFFSEESYESDRGRSKAATTRRFGIHRLIMYPEPGLNDIESIFLLTSWSLEACV